MIPNWHYTLMLCLMLFFQQCYAQTGYRFHSGYQPERLYRSAVKLNSDSEVNFTGSQIMLNLLQSQGMQLPMKIQYFQDCVQHIQSSSKAADGSIALNIGFRDVLVKQNINGKETQSNIAQKLSNMEIRATYFDDGNFRFEESGEFDKNLQKSIPGLMEHFQKQVLYHKDCLKIGEAFTRKIPLELSLAGFTSVKTELVSICKLNRVEGDLAYFDIQQTLVLDQSDLLIKVHAKGRGRGTMVYSFSQQFTRAYNSDMDIELQMSMEGLNAISKSKIHYEQIVSVAPLQ